MARLQLCSLVIVLLWIPQVLAAHTPDRMLYHWQHGEPFQSPGNNGTSSQLPPHSVAASPTNGDGILRPSDCLPACSNRCSATQHLNACMYFCQYCCARCLCVPPGTYGNKESCPCYNSMKTKEGGPKCP